MFSLNSYKKGIKRRRRKKNGIILYIIILTKNQQVMTGDIIKRRYVYR
jgi:hypothetical protein